MNQSETSLDTSELDPSAARIIAAAQVCLIHNGMRITITNVTRRAGVSRPTVYHRSFILEEIISRTLTQEMVGVLGDVTIPTSAKKSTEIIVDVINRVRRDELIHVILSKEPELLVTYQSRRLGHSQLAITGTLERMLRVLPDLSSENPKQQALFILMLVQSVVFMANTMSEYLNNASWKGELRRVLKGYLQ